MRTLLMMGGFGIIFFFFPIIFIGSVFAIVKRLLSNRRIERDRRDFELDGFEGAKNPHLPKPPKESEIFRIAKQYKGKITVSDIVLETGMGVKEAEDLMSSLAGGLHVRMEVNDKGFVVYEFPEIMARFDGDDEL